MSLYNIYRWYDTVQEPQRMLLMLAVVLVGALIFNFMPFLGAAIFVGLVLTRMHYIFKKRNV